MRRREARDRDQAAIDLQETDSKKDSVVEETHAIEGGIGELPR